jgi:hypothetical protein
MMAVVGRPVSDLDGSGLQQPAHVVIHPEWTPEALPPQERVERCITGRAAAAMRTYFSVLD